MSMMWMWMPGQTWISATASFLIMWVPMMAAMMLPSLIPMLRRYRQALGIPGEARLGLLTTLVGAGMGDVDDVDVDARANLDQRHRVIPHHVGPDDGSDDAAVPDPYVAALPPGPWHPR